MPSYTLDELIEWLKEQPNLTELWEAHVESGYEHRLAPSIDRLDDDKPYTLGNIRLITNIENVRKAAADMRSGKLQTTHRKVTAYHRDGTTHSHHESINAAARAVKGYPTNIHKCATGKLKAHRNLIWRFT